MISEPQQQPPFYMAVKTNLLYDALLVPNAGVEFYLGKGFSASGSWMYAWWKKNRRHRYWRIYGGELAIRKYFCRPEGGSPLSGHHLGVYGQILTYDFETGGRGYMGGKPGGTLWEKDELHRRTGIWLFAARCKEIEHRLCHRPGLLGRNLLRIPAHGQPLCMAGNETAALVWSDQG